MTFDPWILFLAGVAYFALLFLIAYATERGWIPSRVVRHPLTYVLSLGVYATSWSYYGSVGFAQTQGYNFLAIYLGVTLTFALTPALLAPIMRLTREYQLASLADLFAFRYHSQTTGALVTVFMLFAILPYISLQIFAVAESIRILTPSAAPALLAFGFCMMLIVFSILFGARHASMRDKHEGLVAAIAFQSAVKLIVLGAVGVFAVFGVFGGFGDLERWLADNPQALVALYQPVQQGPWAVLMVLAFAAAFLLPRQFHMTFAENIHPRTLPAASWGLPLFLLLLNIPIVPVLWAGQAAQSTVGADYYVLGITLGHGSGWLTTVAFLGGLSAASAMIIVETLALSAMCLNHLVLPVRFSSRTDPHENLYERLLRRRRLLIVGIILTAFAFYLQLRANQNLMQLGLTSFVAVAQFLPGIVGLLFWRRATRAGFIGGLIGGGLVWMLALMLPLFEQAVDVRTGIRLQEWLGATDENAVAFGTFWSLAVNSLVFVTLSVLTRPTAEEVDAARACSHEMLPARGVAAALSPQQFTEQLARVLGPQTAEREVRLALDDLDMGDTEHRPPQLRRLRERIERNLSGLIGPLLARTVVDDRLRLDKASPLALADTVRSLEEHLEASRSQLQGLAAELDALRRYHRQILQELPLAVCSLGPGGEIVIWNHAMERLSGLSAREVSAAALSELREPWDGLLRGFVDAQEQHFYKLQTTIRGRSRWFNLHKAAIEYPSTLVEERGGMVILVEDLTERQTLEAELAHTERLASIGRLAAGVAHEIGNPLTGIASLAQNLRDEGDRAVVQESVALIQQQTRRISDIVQSLVTFAHGGLPSERAIASVEIAACVEEAVRLVRLSHAGKQVTFINRCDAGVTLEGDRGRLVQLFVNLLTNASDASRAGDTVEVSSYIEEDLVRLDVVDHGSGIPEELRERIFEPFFTTKQPGEGTGLGLPLVYNIVSDHGGTVTIDSAVDQGTRIIVRLPLGSRRAARSGRPEKMT